MIIRQTSANAYNYLKSSGGLGELQWQTYDVLFRLGGLSASEIFVTIKKEMLAAGVAESVVNELRDTYHQRLSELKGMGLVYEVQERECTVTHREVIEWDVTANLPNKPEGAVKKVSTQKQLQTELAITEARLRTEKESNDSLYKQIERVRAENDQLHKENQQLKNEVQTLIEEKAGADL
jgi:FtsZ-binding cell division protein ZapB